MSNVARTASHNRRDWKHGYELTSNKKNVTTTFISDLKLIIVGTIEENVLMLL